MSTDVREQIRQLTAAFDAFVEDVSVDEIVSSSAPLPADGRLVGLGPVGARQGSDGRRPRVVGVAAAALLVVGLVGALGLAMRSDSDSMGGSAPSDGPSALSTATSFVAAPVAGSVGSFVWPMDDRKFMSLNELVGAFASEVLAWTAFGIEGDTNAENAPQAFDLVDTATGARIQMIAAPLEQAWGFMQIGDGVEASVSGGGTIVVRFPRTPQAVSSSVMALLSDGSVVELSTTTDQFDIATGALEDLAAVLILGRDDTGAVVSVAGGMFAGNPETPETAVAGSVPGATAPNDAPPATVDPLVFAGTESWLPRWPSMSVSVPPASTRGYGMQLCDSGYGTKILRLDSPTDTSHAYSGTLCVFIELVQPRADATVSCSTSTPPYNYARCARRTDRTDSAGGGTAATAAATTAQQDAMRLFPSATDWSESEVFAGVVSSATNATVRFADSTGSISLTPAPESADLGVDQPGVCFVIELETATANGCVGRGLLATGLAYGAFRDGNGAIELVGIVPDEVTTIDIGGTLITPVGNIWHTTLDSGEATPRITARSADGRESSTT
jgi:hypothetical protein